MTTSSVNPCAELLPQAETPEQLLHRRLKQAIAMEVGHPKRDERIYGATQLYMVITGDVEGGIGLYDQFASEQL